MKAPAARSLAILALVAVIPLPLFAQEAPPRILQIYRERVKPSAEAEYARIEEERARICARLKYPHAYLALASPGEPREVWWLNAYTSEADRDAVARAWERNTAAAGALRQSEPRKKELVVAGTDVFAVFRSDESEPSCWRMAGTRFFAVAVLGAGKKLRGCVFASADGTRFAFAPAATRAEAARKAAAVGPGAKVFAVQPSWSLPEDAWIAADPRFWRSSPAAKRRLGR